MISKFNHKLESMVEQVVNDVLDRIEFKDMCNQASS